MTAPKQVDRQMGRRGRIRRLGGCMHLADDAPSGCATSWVEHVVLLATCSSPVCALSVGCLPTVGRISSPRWITLFSYGVIRASLRVRLRVPGVKVYFRLTFESRIRPVARRRIPVRAVRGILERSARSTAFSMQTHTCSKFRSRAGAISLPATIGGRERLTLTPNIPTIDRCDERLSGAHDSCRTLTRRLVIRLIPWRLFATFANGTAASGCPRRRRDDSYPSPKVAPRPIRVREPRSCGMPPVVWSRARWIRRAMRRR